MTTDLFCRPDGVHCYRGCFFPVDSPRTVARILLDCGVGVLWCSQKSHTKAAGFLLREESSHKIPDSRGLTKLTLETARDLERDWGERDGYDYRRASALFVVRANASEGILGPSIITQTIEQFARLRMPALEIIVLDLGDSPSYAYVSPRLKPGARRVLEALGVEVENPDSIQDYKRLGRSRLECWVESIVRLAYPVKG